MRNIDFISKTIKEFFNQLADNISLTTGFIKRKRKLKGSSFIKAMVLGNLGDANCSIERMCQLLNEDCIEITKQGLDFRFTEEAVTFMRSMFYEALVLFKNKLQVDCDILKRFSSVKLLDSSNISLPNIMENLYKGCGAKIGGYSSNAKSAIKLQVVFDYLNQVLDKIDIKEGIRSDQGYRDYLSDIAPNNLLIFDLGYFVPNSFKHIEESNAYFISRYKSDTNIYDIETNRNIELLECLENQSFMEKEILLGKEAKLKVRIVCIKLSPEQSNARRRKANKLAKSHGYKSSQKNQRLLDWSIFITNVPKDKIPAEQIFLIYKIRWQIELLFKLYKSHIKIENLKGKLRASRVLCELYAKLCIVAIFHGVANCMTLVDDRELSFTKAMIELKRRSRELLSALNNNTLKGLKKFLAHLIKAWSKFSIKDRYRYTRISTLSAIKLVVINP